MNGGTSSPPGPDHAEAAGDTAARHAATWALIPWLVNGRAEARPRALAEQHLAGCADCRAELRAQQLLSGMLQQQLPPATAELDAEQGLRRLLGRLDQSPQHPPASAPARSTVDTAAPRRRAAGRLTWALAAAVLLQAGGLVLLSLQLADRADAPYTTLSQPVPGAPGAARLRVVPDGALPMQQWQALLLAHRLQVVDGPNAAGAYVLVPLSPAVPVPELLAQLRASPAVRLAEVMDPAR